MSSVKSQIRGDNASGSYPCVIEPNTLAAEIYASLNIDERHRHRYEVSPLYHQALSDAGLSISGLSPDGTLAEIVELADHPFFIACQFHPEFKSRPIFPHPLFVQFIRASLKRQEAAW